MNSSSRSCGQYPSSSRLAAAVGNGGQVEEITGSIFERVALISIHSFLESGRVPCSKIASTGHAGEHAPQSMQMVGSMYNWPASA